MAADPKEYFLCKCFSYRSALFCSGILTVILTLFQHNNYEHGMDINVTEVWSHNVTGRGVTVAVVDDGKLVTII